MSSGRTSLMPTPYGAPLAYQEPKLSVFNQIFNQICLIKFKYTILYTVYQEYCSPTMMKDITK